MIQKNAILLFLYLLGTGPIVRAQTITDSIHVIGFLDRAMAMHREGQDTLQSLPFIMKAELLSSKIGWKLGVAKSLNQHANIINDYGDSKGAIAYYKRALQTFEELHNQRGVAIVTNNIGNAYLTMEDYESATSWLTKAATQFEIVFARDTSKLCVLYGNLQSALGSCAYDELAAVYGEKRFLLGSASSDRALQADAFNSKAFDLMGQGQDSLGLQMALKAWALAEEEQSDWLLAQVSVNMQHFFLKYKRYTENLKYSRKGLGAAERLGQPRFLSVNQLAFAKTMLGLGKLDSAKVMLLCIVKNPELSNEIEAQSEANLYLSKVCMRQNNTLEASLYLERHLELAKQLQTEQNRARVAALETRYRTAQKDKTIATLEVARLQNRFWIICLVAVIFAIGISAIALVWYFKHKKNLSEQQVQTLKAEKALEALSVKQQTQLEERKRLSQDLHDDLGSGLTSIVLLSEVTKQLKGIPEQQSKHLETIANTARALTTSLGELVWMLNPEQASLESFLAFTRKHAHQYFESTMYEIEVRFDYPETIPEIQLSEKYRRNLILVFKEALHNIYKHSKATSVNIKLQTEADNQLVFSITDNGVGIDKSGQNLLSNGLKNMKERMMQLDGTLDLRSSENLGTVIVLTFRAS